MVTKLKITLTLLLFFISFFYSCNLEKNNNKNNQSQVLTINRKDVNADNNCLIINDISFDRKDVFLTFIEKERATFYDTGHNISYEAMYTDSSISFVFPIFSYWLNKKMYKPVSDSIFKTRIYTIFGIDISTLESCDDIIINKDYIEYYTYKAYGTEGDIITTGSFLLTLKYNLFFRAPFNGHIVEEIDRTQRYLTCFPDNLYHYNNFIFYDSQSSLSWLINNDIEFLEILVREFGYDKNDKINKAVLESINEKYISTQPRNYELLENLFAKKDYNGNLNIRQHLMEYISEFYNQDKDTPLAMLDDYAYRIVDLKKTGYNQEWDFTKEERFKIATFAGYYEQLARNRNSIDGVDDSYNKPIQEGWLPGSFLRNEFVGNNEFLEVIKENNYYELPDFENIISNILIQIESQSEEYNRSHY